MSKRTFLLLFLLLFITRAALVLSIADVFFYGDELAKGTASKALIEGIGIPRWQLNYVYHEGGGFIVIHLKALVFWLIGQSVLAHKITAILTASALLAVGCWFTSENFGRGAGAIFGLLFALCPDSFMRFSLLSIGTHFEGLILIALILHYATRILFDERAPLTDWAFLGMFSGLGLYFSLQSAPVVALVALAIPLRLRRHLFGAGTLVAALCFVLGGMPLWTMMSHVGTAAVTVQEHPNLDAGLKGWEALREFFHQLVREPDVGSWVQAVGFAIVIPAGLFSIPGAAGKALRARSTLILAYLALFLLLYAGSGFAIAHQGEWTFWLRSAPLWFFSTVLFSACAGALLEHAAPRWREVTLGVVTLFLVGGLAGFAGLLSAARPSTPSENWRILTKTKGYDFSEYFDKLIHHFGDSLPERFSVLSRFRDDPELLLPAMNHSLFEHSGRTLPEAVEFTRANYGGRWLTALEGLGLIAAPNYGHDIPAALAAVESQPAETRPALAEAVGRVALGLRLVPEKIDEQVRMAVPGHLREAFLRGAGWRVYRIYRVRPDLALALIQRQPEDAQPALMDGYLRARAANTLK
jgi:hypothetical protein